VEQIHGFNQQQSSYSVYPTLPIIIRGVSTDISPQNTTRTVPYQTDYSEDDAGLCGSQAM